MLYTVCLYHAVPARLPIQNKSPFEIDPRPLDEMASPHAGFLAFMKTGLSTARQRLGRRW